VRKCSHISDVELAGWDGEVHPADWTEHLGECQVCRAALADYRWLETAVGEACTAMIDGIEVPDLSWRTVRAALRQCDRGVRVRRSLAALVCASAAVVALVAASGLTASANAYLGGSDAVTWTPVASPAETSDLGDRRCPATADSTKALHSADLPRAEVSPDPRPTPP
jgi:hypothetical protein